MGLSLAVRVCSALALATAVVQVVAQRPQLPPGSFPHNYPGIPNTNDNFNDSAAWQDCKLRSYSMA
jgi:hypothetical protein